MTILNIRVFKKETLLKSPKPIQVKSFLKLFNKKNKIF